MPDEDFEKTEDCGREEALRKLAELVNCGDKRIELSSAKELLTLLGLPENSPQRPAPEKLEVEIKIL